MKTDAYCVELARSEFHRAAVNVSAVFDLALHTGEPNEDSQRSKEVSLPGYHRTSVMRDEDTWSVQGRKVINAAKVTFPTITSGQATATHISIGIEGVIRRYMKLKVPVELKANRRVEFEPGDIEIEELD